LKESEPVSCELTREDREGDTFAFKEIEPVGVINFPVTVDGPGARVIVEISFLVSRSLDEDIVLKFS